MSERQIADIATRTRTSLRPTGRNGYSLRTNGAFCASYTAALVVRSIRPHSVRNRKCRNCANGRLRPAGDTPYLSAATTETALSAHQVRHGTAIDGRRVG